MISKHPPQIMGRTFYPEVCGRWSLSNPPSVSETEEDWRALFRATHLGSADVVTKLLFRVREWDKAGSTPVPWTRERASETDTNFNAHQRVVHTRSIGTDGRIGQVLADRWKHCAVRLSAAAQAGMPEKKAGPQARCSVNQSCVDACWQTVEGADEKRRATPIACRSDAVFEVVDISPTGVSTAFDTRDVDCNYVGKASSSRCGTKASEMLAETAPSALFVCLEEFAMLPKIDLELVDELLAHISKRKGCRV